MSKSAKQKLERMENIVIGAGFLLKKLYGRYSEDFSHGMHEQVRQCLKDVAQVEAARIAREKAASDAKALQMCRTIP